MHHYGGVYLDLDIECYKPIDASLKGYQLVLQGTGDEGFNNAVMASVPGLSRLLLLANPCATLHMLSQLRCKPFDPESN